MNKSTTILVALLLTTTIFSCTKSSSSSNSSSTSKQPFLQFNGNGVTYTCKASWNPNDSTWDYGPSIQRFSNGFWLNMDFTSTSAFYLWSNDTLKIGNLNVPYPDGILNSVTYHNGPIGNSNGTVGTISVTRISNGTADGTFNAVAQPDSSNKPVMNITQGQFSNILIK